MRVIPTMLHGVLDYLTVVTLFIMPRFFNWDQEIARLPQGSAVFTLLYSMMTRYELGLIRILPMRVHLLLDGLQGLAMVATLMILPREERTARYAFMGFGLFEIAAALMTRKEAQRLEAPAPVRT